MRRIEGEQLENRDEIEVMFIDWERGIDFNMTEVDFQDTTQLRIALDEIAIKSPILHQYILVMARMVMETVNETKT